MLPFFVVIHDPNLFWIVSLCVYLFVASRSLVRRTRDFTRHNRVVHQARVKRFHLYLRKIREARFIGNKKVSSFQFFIFF